MNHFFPASACRRSASMVAATAALALMLPSLAAHAQHSTEVIVGSQSFTSVRLTDGSVPPAGWGQQFSPRSSSIHPTEASVTSGWTQSVGGWEALGSGSASGSAGWGFLKAQADAYGVVIGAADAAAPSNGSGAANAAAKATLADTLVFAMPGVAVGTPVTISWAMGASGTVGGSGQRLDVEAFWRGDLGSSGIGGGGVLRQDESGALVRSQTMPEGRMLASSEVLLGRPVSLTMSVSAGAVAQSAGRCFESGCGERIEVRTFGSADLSHTLTWGGLVGISDASGNALDLSALSVVASSGYDYRTAYLALAPVPEPGTLGLMLAGLAGMALLGKRRRAATA